MTWQDISHASWTSMFAITAWMTENVFEIVGAAGVILNLVFVARSHYENREIRRYEKQKLMLEHELLKKQIGD